MLRAVLDTNIAVHLRDGTGDIAGRVHNRQLLPLISILTVIELEAGLHRVGEDLPASRMRLDLLLRGFEILPLGPAEATAYARIVERCGYSRPRIIDRLIAATTIAADATLITMNGADFRNLPELKLEVWPSS